MLNKETNNLGLNSENEIQEIPISLILEDNSFKNREKLEVDDLEKSIKYDGQKLPIILRRKGERYQLISGFRRMTACKKIGLDTIKAVVYDRLDDKEAHKIGIIENVQRESYNNFEILIACKRVKDDGLSNEEISKIFGKSIRAIQRYFVVANATNENEKLKFALQQDRIKPEQAYELVRSGISINEFFEKNLSVRDLRRIASKEKRASKAINYKPFKTGGFNLRINYKPNRDFKEKKEVLDTLQKVIDRLKG